MNKFLLSLLAIFGLIFSSSANNLELISKTVDGKPAGNPYFRDVTSYSNVTDIDISSNGRFITFCSSSNKIVPNDTNLYETLGRTGGYEYAFDIFRFDRVTKEIKRISLWPEGTQMDTWDSRTFSTSADGETTVFHSWMLDNQINISQVFYKSSTQRLFPYIDLVEERFVLSGNGNYLAYYSYYDIYRLDMQTGENIYVSHPQFGGKMNQSPAHFPAISFDGRYAAFVSNATNLTKEATGGLFISDCVKREIKLVTPNNVYSMKGLAFNEDSSSLFFSLDGLIATLSPSPCSLYEYNLTTSEIKPIQISDKQNTYFNNIYPFAVTPDGRFIAFRYYNDFYWYDRETQKLVHLLTADRILVSTFETSDGAMDLHLSHGRNLDISDDGKLVVFTTNADLLVPEDTNSQFDAYLIEVEEESSAENWELFDTQ